MAPSRGHAAVAHSTDDAAVKQQGNTALVNARRNLNYLISPASAKDQPARYRTRALLRVVRYIGTFIIWRLVRWAKYVAVGALVAAIGATAFGGVMTGAAWLAAPPTMGASIMAYTVYGVGKYVANKFHKRWQKTGGDAGEVAREEQEDSPIRRNGAYGQDMGPQAVPW